MLHGDEAWKNAYQNGKGRRKVWTRIEFADGEVLYLEEIKEWLTLKSDIEASGKRIVSISLKYRTHLVTVDTTDAEAVYLVQSLMAQFGGDTIHFITTGVLKEGTVYKTRWHIPALVEETKTEESLDNCFAEAIIYNGREA